MADQILSTWVLWAHERFVQFYKLNMQDPWQLSMTCQTQNFIGPSRRWVLKLVRQTVLDVNTRAYLTNHYNDIIVSTMASQITNVSSGADQRKHQSSASLAFVQGIHRSSVNSQHKEPVTWKMFPFDDVIITLPMPVPYIHRSDFDQHEVYRYLSSTSWKSHHQAADGRVLIKTLDRIFLPYLNQVSIIAKMLPLIWQYFLKLHTK